MNVYRMVEAEGWIVTSAETYWAVWKPSNRRQDWLALMHRSKFVSAPTLDALLQQLPPSHRKVPLHHLHLYQLLRHSQKLQKSTVQKSPISLVHTQGIYQVTMTLPKTHISHLR